MKNLDNIINQALVESLRFDEEIFREAIIKNNPDIGEITSEKLKDLNISLNYDTVWGILAFGNYEYIKYVKQGDKILYPGVKVNIITNERTKYEV